MDPYLALEAVSDGVLSLDAEWRFTYVNRGGELLLRQQQQTLLGRSWWEVFPYLVGTPAEKGLRDAAASRGHRRLKIFHPPMYAWHEVDAIHSADDLILVIRDVTDVTRMRRTEAMRTALREVLDPAPIAIAILRGPEHRIELMNPMARQLLGDRDLEGRTVRNALPEIENQGFIEILDRVYQTGEPFEGKEVPVRYDRYGNGEMYEGVFNVTYQPFFETDGRVAGVLSISVEVTDFVKERDRLRQASR
ncbi:MAG TPA: PAS domain-containing protein [Longimicrobiaceae bacterium]|nr:PAS domain-containing protein [Longimicrobiaceae bacterium]